MATGDDIMYVMKFGVASVSEAARLRSTVDLCRTRPNGSLVVVCTAIAGVTDTLISAARSATTGDEAAVEIARRDIWSRHRTLAEKVVHDEWERETLYREWAALLKTFDRVTRSIMTLGDRSLRGIDAIAALGERFVSHLVGTVLRQHGIAAKVIDAAELIVTDDHFGAARPFPQESAERIRKRLQPALQSGIVPVITGYIGATREGVVTTLGRSGGDYTAALIGAVMGAEEVWIWTDVDGILTADPKIVYDAQTLEELSYVEAAEIATFGVEVLHSRTLIPIIEHNVVLRIRNALRPNHPGTRIVARPQPSSRAARTIISAHGLSMLTLTSKNEDDWTPDLAARTLTRLSDTGVDVLSFTQSFSQRSLALTVRSTDAAFASESLRAIFHHNGTSDGSITITAPVALVSVISTTSSTLMPLVLTALGQADAHVLALAQSSTSFHISFILPESEVQHVVRTLHRDLRLA